MGRHGISIHSAAAYVIARRGQGFKEKPASCFDFIIGDKKKNHHWSQWNCISRRFAKIKNHAIRLHPLKGLVEAEARMY